jgi:hypothetical protein
MIMIMNEEPNVATQLPGFPFPITDAPDSNLGPETDYPKLYSFQANSKKVQWNWPRTISTESLKVHDHLPNIIYTAEQHR